MALSARDISDIEKNFPDGLSSRQILDLFDEHGERLSEATLRKYVQLGLLPRSRRVGEKGKHRGSRGIYPVDVIRRVDEIRRAMTDGETLEELARASQGVRAKLSSARVSIEEALEAAEADLVGHQIERKRKTEFRSELTTLRKDVRGWLRTMEKWTTQLRQAERQSDSKGRQDSKPVRGVRRNDRARKATKRPRRRGGE